MLRSISFWYSSCQRIKGANSDYNHTRSQVANGEYSQPHTTWRVMQFQWTEIACRNFRYFHIRRFQYHLYMPLYTIQSSTRYLEDTTAYTSLVPCGSAVRKNQEIPLKICHKIGHSSRSDRVDRKDGDYFIINEKMLELWSWLDCIKNFLVVGSLMPAPHRRVELPWLSSQFRHLSTYGYAH